MAGHAYRHVEVVQRAYMCGSLFRQGVVTCSCQIPPRPSSDRSLVLVAWARAFFMLVKYACEQRVHNVNVQAEMGF
jgi:hypothetical protein